MRSVPDGLLRVTGPEDELTPAAPIAAHPLAADPMLEFLLKRLATIVPTLVFVSMLIFGLQQLLPGDPAVILAGEERTRTSSRYLREKLHLDEPLPVRYAVLGRRRAAGRPRRVGAQPAAGARR